MGYVRNSFKHNDYQTNENDARTGMGNTIIPTYDDVLYHVTRNNRQIIIIMEHLL